MIEGFERAGVDHGAMVFDPESARDLVSIMDHYAFAICVRNLIENGLKHGGDNGPVEITVIGSNTIQVANGGPAVSPDDFSELKKRFKRSNSKAGGAGLGLAIVETIMRNTKGELTLYSPRPDKADGFMAELRLHQS